MRQSRLSLSRKLETAITIVVVIVAIIAGLAALGGRSSSSSSIVLAPSGYVFSLSPGYYYYIKFTTPSDATDIFINGSYVSNNNVEVLILTPVEFGAFTQNPGGVISSGDYVWYSGDNTGATLNATLAPGQTYYLVFFNDNLMSNATDTIEVVLSITVWGYPTGG